MSAAQVNAETIELVRREVVKFTQSLVDHSPLAPTPQEMRVAVSRTQEYWTGRCEEDG